jgi:hypothetical protein
MRYASLLLVLTSAVVAIHGETWNPNGSGLRRVTTTGWITLTLAIIGFGLSVALVRQDAAESKSDKAALVEAKDNAVLAAIDTDSMKVKLDYMKQRSPHINPLFSRSETIRNARSKQ